MKSLYILCFQLILVSCLPTNEEKARQEQRILDSITDVKERDALRAKHFNDSVKLLNIMGEVILISNKKEIDIGSIPNGVYFLNFETEKYISSKKIVIQH